MVKHAEHPTGPTESLAKATSLHAHGWVRGIHAISAEAQKVFIIENPQTSRIWRLGCMTQLFSDPSVTWGDFHFCAYGLKGPESGLRCLKPTSLMHCLPPKVMRPIFRKCANFTCSVKHEHQPLEGHAGTYGSRTKLAQVSLPVLPGSRVRHHASPEGETALSRSPTSRLISFDRRWLASTRNSTWLAAAPL